MKYKINYCLVILVSCFGCGEIIEENIEGREVMMLSPGDSTTIYSDTVSLWWEEVDGARNYEVRLVSPDFSNPQQVVMDTVTTQILLNILLTSGSYEWEVRALNEGYFTKYASRKFSVDSVLIMDISNETIQLITPAQGGVFQQDSAVLWWESLGEQVQYDLRIASPSLANPRFGFDTTVFANQLILKLDTGQYEWMIRGTNGRFVTSWEQSQFSLTALPDSLVDITTDQVEILAPANDLKSEDDNLLFWWSELGRADSYELQIVSPSFDNAIDLFDTIMSGSQLRMSLSEGEYEFKVRGLNDRFKSQWSLVRSFEILPEIFVDISATSVQLLAPADNFESSSGELTFWWDELAGASSYELRVVNPSFDNTINLYDTIVSVNEVVMSLPEGFYEFQVRGVNDRFNSQWSSVRSFEVLPEAFVDLSAVSVQLLAPGDNLESSASELTFWWELVDGADEYEFVMVTPSFDAIESLVTRRILTEEEDQLTLPLDSGSYQWGVKAINAQSESPMAIRNLKIN